MTRVRRRMRQCHESGGGFTLLEVIVALAVLSVATYIIIAMYTSSQDMANDTRRLRAAAALAEQQLTAIRTNPGGFVWPELSTDAPARLLPQGAKEEDGPHPVAQPDEMAMPPDPKAGPRERDQLLDYNWFAVARLPEADAPYAEVTVVVLWTSGGRVRHFPLTTLMPRPQPEGAA